MKKILVFIWAFAASNLFGQTYELISPDNKLKAEISVKKIIDWSLTFEQNTLVKNCTFSLDFNDKMSFNDKLKVTKVVKEENSETIFSPVPTKFRSQEVRYNKLLLKFKNNLSAEFRLYNEGFAYRIISNQKTDLIVNNEPIQIEFPDKCRVLFPQEESLQSHYERSYVDTSLSALNSGSFASLPLLVQTDNGNNIVISDADLYDYPCLFLEKAEGNILKSKFPNAVLETLPAQNGADRNEIISKEADYIAKTAGKRNLPWRVFAIAETDKQLLENQMVFNLSREGNTDDFKWVKPGKVAWDWWNANNIYGVDFKSGLNTETYKYYIDFASDFGLEYIILDEGWSKTTTNLFHANPDIDIEALMNYAKSKDVKIILWVLWKPLYQDIDSILEQFVKWGAAGIKVDFMQRADQQMVNIYELITKKAAEQHLLVDFHGAFKPSGLRRAYPNLMAYEGVKGLEHNKWSKDITPDHNLTLPFIRMLAGPMDYTPGAMRNKQLADFAVSFNCPMSIGTRAHQAALYVVFESPLQMLADNPSNYYDEEDCARFIAKIPTTWDETKAIEAKIGDYLVSAKRNGNNWYIGALTDWDERSFEIELSFLDDGIYSMEMLQDGVNANTFAEDYTINMKTVRQGDVISIKMAKGGGFAAILTKLE